MPAASPTTTAPRVFTVPHDGVIATRPATTPEAAPKVVGLPSRICSTDEPAQHAEAAGDQRVEEDRRGRAVGGQRRTGVEPEPAEPQQADAEQHEGQVVRAHRVVLEADARAEHQRQRQRRRAGDDLDDQAARVVAAHRAWTASRPAPTPSARPRAYTATVQTGDEDHPGRELGAVGDGAADQCGGDDREGQLEGGEQQFGNRCRARCPGRCRACPTCSRSPIRPPPPSSENASV